MTLYGAKGGNTASSLYTINPLTGVCTPIGAIGYAVTGLAWDVLGSTMYGMTSNNSPVALRSLLTINLGTGAGTLVGATGLSGATPIVDIACSPIDGTLYGTNNSGQLYTINKATGVATPFGSALGSGTGSVLEYAANGLFNARWTAAFGWRVFERDPVTGAATLIATFTGAAIGSIGNFSAMALNPLGMMNLADMFTGPNLDTVEVDGTFTVIAAFSTPDIDALGFDGARGTFAVGPPPTPPPNDDFADAEVIVGDNGTVPGTTVNATSEGPDDPLAQGSHSEQTVWYSFTPTQAGFLTLTPVAGTLTGAAIGVYTGAALGALTEVAFDEDLFAMPSIDDLEVEAGVTYRVEITGYNSSLFGTFDLTWLLRPLNDDFDFAIGIVGTSGSDSSVDNNTNATLQVDEPVPSAGPVERTVWWKLEQEGLVTLDLAGSVTIALPEVWEDSHLYLPNDRITVATTVWQTIMRYGTSGAVEPTWANGVVDDEITWYQSLLLTTRANNTLYSGFIQIVEDGRLWYQSDSGTTGLSPPTWSSVPTAPGASIVDGTITWYIGGDHLGPWQANHDYEVIVSGFTPYVSPTTPDGYAYQLGSSSRPNGLSGLTEPTWTGLVTDNDLFWFVAYEVGAPLDTVLAVYTGPTIDALTEVVSDDSSSGDGTNGRVSFVAEDNTYWVQVGGYEGSNTPGSITLSWEITPFYPTPNPAAGMFVWVGQAAGGRLLTATDPAAWTERMAVLDNQSTCCVGGPGRALAGGSSGSDTDLIETGRGGAWYPDPTPFAGTVVQRMFYADALGRFVALAEAASPVAVATGDVVAGFVEWTGQSSPFDSGTPSGGAYAASLDRMLIVGAGPTGDDRAIYSDDGGLTWAALGDPFTGQTGFDGFLPRTVAWSPTLSLFVCVGFSGFATDVIFTSPDGLVWTGRGNPTGNFANGLSVAWDPTAGIFLVGFDGSDSGVASSTDGIAWVAVAGPPLSIVYGFAAGAGQWVAVGEVGGYGTGGGGVTVMTSPNGVIWTEQNTPIDGDFPTATDVCFFVPAAVPSPPNDGTGKFVFAGQDKDGALAAQTSTDGFTWTPAATPTDFLIGTAAGAVPGRAAISAQSTPDTEIAEYDGTTWTADISPWDGVTPAYGIFGAAGTLLVALAQGVDPVLATADAAVTPLVWTPQVTPFDGGGAGFHGCYSANLNRILVIGQSADFLIHSITSDDGGTTWDPQGLFPDGFVAYDVCRSDDLGLFVAVGLDDNGESIYTSPDGTEGSWTVSSPSPFGIFNTAQAVAWDATAGRFVAGCGGGVPVLGVSPDGIHWAAVLSPLQNITGIVAGAGLWVAVGVTVGEPSTVIWAVDAEDVWTITVTPFDGLDPLQAQGNAVAFMADFPPPAPSLHPTRWRYFVAALDGTGITDWSKLASNRVVRTLLNGPGSVSGSVPSWDPQVYIPYSDAYEDPYCAEGTRLLWGFRRESDTPPYYTCRAATLVQLVQDDAQGDTATTSFVGYDPWQYLFSRPVVNVDGKLPGDEGISWSNTQASEIITQLLRNTIAAHGHAYIDGGNESLGTIYYTGTLETGPGMEIESINFEAGTTVGDAWAQITQTGQCDIVLDPIYDPFNRPNYLAQLNVYAQAGATRDEAVFGWDAAGGRNVSTLNRAIEGGTTRANKAVYWSSGAGQTGRSVVGTGAASVAKYGQYWVMQTFPELASKKMVPIANAYAAVTVQMRGAGRTTVTFSPIAERAPRPWLDYQLGDIVPVIATSKNFRQALEFDPLEPPPHSKAYQRIYGWDTTIDDNSTETIQILTSLSGGVT